MGCYTEGLLANPDECCYRSNGWPAGCDKEECFLHFSGPPRGEDFISALAIHQLYMHGWPDWLERRRERKFKSLRNLRAFKYWPD
jgi:hypothetical protein